VPRALQPVGDCTGRAPRFCWDWQGPPLVWEFVLCDAEMQEVLRVGCVHACELRPTPELATALQRGDYFHWFVEARTADRSVRSAPVALALPHR